MNIIKRDGTQVPFDKEKIKQAVFKVFIAVDGALTPYAEEKAKNIADYIENYFTMPYPPRRRIRGSGSWDLGVQWATSSRSGSSGSCHRTCRGWH